MKLGILTIEKFNPDKSAISLNFRYFNILTSTFELTIGLKLPERLKYTTVIIRIIL